MSLPGCPCFRSSQHIWALSWMCSLLASGRCTSYFVIIIQAAPKLFFSFPKSAWVFHQLSQGQGGSCPGKPSSQNTTRIQWIDPFHSGWDLGYHQSSSYLPLQALSRALCVGLDHRERPPTDLAHRISHLDLAKFNTSRSYSPALPTPHLNSVSQSFRSGPRHLLPPLNPKFRVNGSVIRLIEAGAPLGVAGSNSGR